MFLEIHPVDPQPRLINQVIEVLNNGGVIIFPTDTVYGIGCDIFNQKAVERVCRLRQLDPQRAMLSFICSSISQIAEYSWQLDNDIFKLLKRNLPGPFTFILKSNNTVPKLFKNRKRTIGVRIPDNRITNALVNALGRPMLSSSLRTDDDIMEYLTEPWEIYEQFQNQVDIVIDGGSGGHIASTLIDCTSEPYEIIREGAGLLKQF
jgi:tRNA threonylcarbamoyl adenosine modification protein (Sua5/YciO/YrdC/YwlC family)